MAKEDDQTNCKHENLADDFEFGSVGHCPKGHTGEITLDGRVYCVDCDATIYEVGRGHENCKYGR